MCVSNNLKSIVLSSFLSLSLSLFLSAPAIAEDTEIITLDNSHNNLSTIDLTKQEKSLWQRIRNGFAMQNINDDLTLKYQQYYQNRPEYLRLMVKRAKPFLYHIVEDIEQRNMPTELAFLPMVESSFNPQADSPAKASGLWQFIPSTGKRFNLEQDWWHDQRRDIVASTSAALDYLQNIYDLHGDWHLALASYNWGEGAVGKAVEKNINRELDTDYLNLKMPQETRHYVPKLQALKNIFSNPALLKKLGIEDIENKPYVATFEVNQPIDIQTAAKLANISEEEFKRLNPAHKRPIIKPNTEVVLPISQIDTFRKNLENHDEPLNQWGTYVIKDGETLPDLALRFGLPLSELTKINGITTATRLAEGSTILVPKEFNDDDTNSVDEYLKLGKLPQIIVSRSSAIGYKKDIDEPKEVYAPRLKLKSGGKNSLRSKYLSGSLKVKNLKNAKVSKNTKNAKNAKGLKTNDKNSKKDNNKDNKKSTNKIAKKATKTINKKAKK